MTEFAMELQLKLVIAMDKIDTVVQETRMKVEDENLTDRDGNPVEVYRKQRYGLSIITLTCNGKSILFSKFLEKWREHNMSLGYPEVFNSCFRIGTPRDTDDCATLIYSQLFYRKDWLDDRLEELKDFYKEIFDIDLRII
jgi:hypothetical protein